MKKILLLIFAILQLNAEEIYATFDVEAQKSASLAFSSSGIIGNMYVEGLSLKETKSLIQDRINDYLRSRDETRCDTICLPLTAPFLSI